MMIGRRIDALEARLGVKLLLRTTRRISLTHEGSAFLEDCQRILADLANAEASVSAGGVKASGHLRITAPAGSGGGMWRRWCRLPGAHPDVSLSLNLSATGWSTSSTRASTARCAWATCPTPA
jgi:DNA-binding transcriptional LysR family regulator